MKKTSSIWYFGDIESKDPLRICMDIEEAYALDVATNYERAKVAMEELIDELRANLDIQDIVIEFIPNGPGEDGSTASRETAIRRLRLEMLAGKGPDVFIMRYIPPEGNEGYNVDSGDMLIKSPQKVMENDLFLPLDEYIENNTQHTEWEKFPEVIMDAGCNVEGQQIIPITYTFPVIVYPKETFDYIPDHLLSWNEMLTDIKISPFAEDLLNCNYLGGYWDYLEFSFGELVDYEDECLLFTEEELLQRVKEVLAINPNDVHGSVEEELISAKIHSYLEPVTLLPLYSDDGGITARIETYAAISRTTDRPEESFAVIDTLLSTQVQQNFAIYSEYFCRKGVGGLLMNEELTNIKTGEPIYQNEENYRTVCILQEQITNANFESDVGTLVNDLVSKCVYSPEYIEGEVHSVYESLQRRVKE